MYIWHNQKHKQLQSYQASGVFEGGWRELQLTIIFFFFQIIVFVVLKTDFLITFITAQWSLLRFFYANEQRSKNKLLAHTFIYLMLGRVLIFAFICCLAKRPICLSCSLCSFGEHSFHLLQHARIQKMTNQFEHEKRQLFAKISRKISSFFYPSHFL